MGRPIEPLDVNPLQHRELERIVGASTSPQGMVRRARIILLRAAGRSQTETAAEIGVNRSVVVHWEHRFAGFGLPGLEDAPGRGRRPSIPEAKKDRLITLATQPPPNKTRWSDRSGSRRQAYDGFGRPMKSNRT
jgi:transposase